ncbi:hypothetical protein GR268_45765, partial [Rhizobium leguminosarum]|nr:hypothetical protein [Rhizobium leguminosarum]
FRNEEFLSVDGRKGAAAEAMAEKLHEVMTALDAIRDAALVRPSTFIADLIRNHDERPVQKSLRV